ncbi:conjugating enzyme E2 [Seminavis robusta]|uniref:Conjugating enzyme E2 n=1 Tax=Seminavis robusta TaxID=568900 RepID=A0A9N8E068_9STRA|nr:conjugating enzyme E2 [Seminavis robusta]|eukprot:Sro519_g158930.1 conjugating enzyme E2 (712) ;mRNA; r:6103-8238
MSSSAEAKKFAIRRLYKDWKEIELEKQSLATVSALPTSNLFEWHCNLRPDYGPYTGTVFHLVLRFPPKYPHEPPDVELCSWLSHPNVWNWRASGYALCLDMIQKYYTSTPYTGWTSAYSVLSLLLQLQSFLFADNIDQDYGGTAKSITEFSAVKRCIGKAREFEYNNITTHDGSKVKHTHDNPWPPLPEPTKSAFRGGQRTAVAPATTPPPPLPSDLYTKIFSYLDPQGLIRAKQVCAHWNEVVLSYNLFERTQIMCFHTKATVDDHDAILGIGLKAKHYPDGKNLKMASSPLDILSEHAFDQELVRTGVWGGANEAFDYFLPLVLNSAHGARAAERMERTIHSIMPYCDLSSLVEDAPRRGHRSRGPRGPRGPQRREQPAQTQESHQNFHPLMAFQLLATLMNSMVVELMNSAQGSGVSRFASEKALEGYCAFHHMLLFFAKRYPMLIEYAEQQVQRFISANYYRHKRQVPNLGVLLVCLTLSKTGWNSLRRPLVMEAFDRNVRWILQEYPLLAKESLKPADRLLCTFDGAKTSLRLLMFQTYFMSRIGRPAGAKGPLDVLDQYDRQMGKPTPEQKRDLQRTAKEILAVTTWPQFFRRLGGSVPPSARLVEILKEAVGHSARKRYHDPDRAQRIQEEKERRAARIEQEARELARRTALVNARIDGFWDRREQMAREREEAERERHARVEAERAELEDAFALFRGAREDGH